MAKERTQAEQAYNELSHRILILEIPPNDRIKEEFWSKKLGVSRSAIRESLTRLLGEGIVRAGERGGFFVSEMSEEEIREIRELREILETAAFSLACDRATPEQVTEIEETCADFLNFVNKNYLTSAHEADLRFHKLLIKASGNSRLVQLYRRSHIPLFHRKMTRAQINLEDFLQTEREHRMILDSLQRKDKKGGTELLRAHFRRGESEALSRDAD